MLISIKSSLGPASGRPSRMEDIKFRGHAERCLSWVGLGSREPFAQSPPYADERTSSDRVDWSVSCPTTEIIIIIRRIAATQRYRGRGQPTERTACAPHYPVRLSPVPVLGENVVSFLHYRVAGEPALGIVRLWRLVIQSAGPERIG